MAEVKRLQEWAEQEVMELLAAGEGGGVGDAAAAASRPVRADRGRRSRPPLRLCRHEWCLQPRVACVHVPVEPVQKFDPSVLAHVAVLSSSRVHVWVPRLTVC